MHTQVLVVGAGPAGGDLARRLARRGVVVLLVDRLADLDQAAFSSAALPLEAVEIHGLPPSVVASRWSRWEVIGPQGRSHHWQGAGPLGVVLDFGALRRWLVGECSDWGGRVWLGHRALGTRRLPCGAMETLVRDPAGNCVAVRSEWVVDATGEARALLGEPLRPSLVPHPVVSGLGVEWLLETPLPLWERWSDRLAFCLGSRWVPQGYGWVFPMQPGRLKVGVCRLVKGPEKQPPLGGLLRDLLDRLLPPLATGGFRVLDRHGGRIRSTLDRRELHRRGRLLGLGDAVSTANLLGGEGIRHALTSSRVLAPLLVEAMGAAGRADADAVDRYPAELRRALGWRWALSGRIARRTWLGLEGERADRRLERILGSLEGGRAEDLSELLFDYRFERYGWRALPYLLRWR